MLGLEVEGVQKISGEFDGIVVAQILTRDKHPDSDKLSVCKVNDGKGERTDHLRRAESSSPATKCRSSCRTSRCR